MNKLFTLPDLVLPPGKRVYFASDFHLGAPDAAASLAREKRIVRWLDEAAKDAAAIYLLGDLFDFWFEYKKTVAKGFTRFLGKLAELHDKGIRIHIFTGNHDMWIFDYLPKEIGAQVYKQPLTLNINNKKLCIGHGDGLKRRRYLPALLDQKVHRNLQCVLDGLPDHRHVQPGRRHVAFDDQINVTAASGVVHARAKQPDLTVGTQSRTQSADDQAGLLRLQAHDAIIEPRNRS